MTEYPPFNCPHCGGGVMVRLAQVFDGQQNSWRTGYNLVPNYVSEQEYEVYDKAWCSQCQTQFFVEGR